MKTTVLGNLSLIFCLLFLAPFAFSQNNTTVSGKITDNNGSPLFGATVAVKGTTAASTTDADGEFSVRNVTALGTLVVSYVGFVDKEIKYKAGERVSLAMDARLAEGDEVVVTGVFDRRKKMESSVAISTLSSEQINRIVPSSSIDLLRNVPGVYVNASRGEVNSSVYTRGLSYNGGFFYVSLQEDGLPILSAQGTSATDPGLKPDGFLRADATIEKVEAVRGGTASILGANAPGGIFNYISKTGKSTFEGEVRTRYGLEGNGKNPYYRADVNVGGPMNASKNLTYNIGGFYRHAQGAKYPGYPLSYGGQVKGNIVKKYSQGSFKLYVKYLDDHTAQYEMSPTKSFSSPTIVDGFDNTSSTIIQPVSFKVPSAITGGNQIDYNSRNVGKYLDKVVGLNWEHRLGNGWSITNNARYSSKENTLNTTQIVFPFRVDQVTFYGVAGLVGKVGTFNFFNPSTGKSYGTVAQSPNIINGNFAGFKFAANNLNLPGNNVQPNSLFYNPAQYFQINTKDFIDQFAITKKLKNMSFTAGGYFSSASTIRNNTIPSAQGFATIESQPKLVGITFTDPSGKTFRITDVNGIANYGGSGFYYNNARVNNKAIFFGHSWQVSSKWNVDYGFRYEKFDINAKFKTPLRMPDSKGGVDGDSLTLYDNRMITQNPEQSFKKDLGTFSYSAAANYKVSENFAIYGRYSVGSKSPDLSFYLDVANQSIAATNEPKAQKTQQIEAGIKAKGESFNLFLTPFYSLLSNVPNNQIFQDAASAYYAPSQKFQKIRTLGVEFEGNYQLNKYFGVRALGVVQTSKAVDYSVFLARTTSVNDDTLVVYSGNKTDNVPNLMFNITPTLTLGKLYTSVTWNFMGDRWANVANAFQLPSYHQFDLNMGLAFSKRVQLSASINNLFNTYGVMTWAAPGGFPASLDTQGFTKAMLNSNQDAVYATLGIPARAYFLTAAFKF